MKLGFSRQIFEKKKKLRYKFNQLASSGIRAVPCGRNDGRTDGQTEITKFILAFHKFANASKDEGRTL